MTQIAVNYAQALYDLASDEQLTPSVLQQLQALRTAFEEAPDFLRLLASPNVSKQERCAVLEESFRDKLHPYLLNFLKILTEQGHIRHFIDCCKHFESCYYADHGILPVQAITARALTSEQTQRLTRKLQTVTGKTVLLENRVDPSCLGGVRLRYDGKQVDGTVKGRLDGIGELLKRTVL